MKFPHITSALLLAGSASAIFPQMRTIPPPLSLAEAEAQSDPTSIQKRATTGQGVFKQLIDHNNPDLGTFDQAFWWSSQFYAGPGSPVVFMTPGEVAAAGYTGYLTNRTITGLFAQAIGGAVVIMEHRYWGTSSPFTDLTTLNMTYLTLNQSIQDTTYFARNVEFPFDVNGSSSADNAPWVFSGGSYSGALSAYVESVDPGTFWAYHASSAVVQTIDDFWQYFVPVQAGMPQNCSTDVSLVIDYIDSVLNSNDTSAKQALKEKFGLGDIVHDDDFASALENGPWQWQGNSFTTGYSAFYEWCDYIENVGAAYPNATAIPNVEGVGLEKALDGYAKWTKEVMFPDYCAGYGYWNGTYDAACFDTYDAGSPFFTDVSLDNVGNRQWMWFLCNEPIKFWQDGAPADTPSIVSRLVNPAYWERQCGLYFPEPGTFGIAEGKDVDDTNAYTGGWDHTDTTRLIWTNGQFDPWKDATVSSDFRPGGPFTGTPDAPVQIIPGGIHCPDLIASQGVANAGAQLVIDNEVKQIKEWVEEYYVEKKKSRSFRRNL